MLKPYNTKSKSKDLKQCFETILNRQELYLSMDNLREILTKALDIKIQALDTRLVNVLADSIIYFMTIWPGWERSSEYFNGTLKFDEWLERFKLYLVYKVNYIIMNEKEFLPEPVEKNCCTSLPIIDPNCANSIPIAPYNFVIGGPPKILNNVYFLENKGDVVIKQHASPAWIYLPFKQVANWPYISAEITLPQIGIKRKNLHEMRRYLSLDIMTYTNVDHLYYVKKIKENAPQVPFTVNYLSSYLDQYLKFLSTVPGISVDRLLELRAISNEFLLDIREVDLNSASMATNTSVCFNIGRNIYIRNKKADSRNRLPNINFYEIMIPKVEFSLTKMTDCQEMETEHVSFVRLNELKGFFKSSRVHHKITELVRSVNNASITYTCEPCVVSFSGSDTYANLMNHLKTTHKSENPVFCQKCLKRFEVAKLCDLRWSHDCGV